MIQASELLRYEAGLREAPTRDAFVRAIVDTTPELIGADRLLAFRSVRGRWRLEASSYVSSIEPNAPAVRELERQANDGSLDLVLARDRHGRPLAAIAICGAVPTADRRAVRERLAAVWSQGYMSHGCRAPRRGGHLVAIAAVATVLAIGCVPASVTVLAPFEIVARDPAVLTAPVDGVVERLALPTDRPVRAAQTVAILDPTRSRDELHLAERRLSLADAKLMVARKSAFSGTDERSTVILARSERDVAAAERDALRHRLARLVLRAPIDGVLLHAGREGWAGRTVRAGERIAEIADPRDVQARIELAVSDVAMVEAGASVRLFADGSLNAVSAAVERVSYLPEATQDARLIYAIDAVPDRPLRIGTRGTARIAAPRRALWWHVLRRPFTTFRQWTGL